jgi:chromosome segregation ATPase
MMLMVLGFLIASLIALGVAPAYRRRIARLTSERIRQSIPVTEAEIKADKDRLRAQYAIRVHKLEAEAEQQRLAAARQLIEMNRRDAEIAALEGEIEKTRAEIDESINARRVLEHTVTDSLPKLEQRLTEARQLLLQRDQEISGLNTETMKSVRALDEAMQINAQQRQDIDRLTTALNTRAAVNRDGLNDARFDSELAFKAEIEALRSRARDQASLISRMQPGASNDGPAADGAQGSDLANGRSTGDVERLKRDLAEAETALRSVRGTAEAGSAGRAAAESKLVQLQAKIDDQAAEIAQLKAALEAYQAAPDEGRSISLKDSRIAAKARISSLQAQLTQQLVTIQRLRAEVASGNERLARQAAHFMDEMRRLGAGTLPVSAEARRARAPAPRRSLSERIGTAKPALASRLAPSPQRAEAAPAEPAAAEERNADRSKVSEFLKALSPSQSDDAAGNGTGPEQGSDMPATAAGRTGKSKFRLMERLTGIAKG